MSKEIHRNCHNFAPVDVAKGICHLSGEMISSDESGCEHFSPLPRCDSCRNYRKDSPEAHTGTCDASSQKFLAYADMCAVTCEHYRR